MQISELTIRERALYTYRDIQARKAAKSKGEKDAKNHIFENSERIKKSQRRMKGRIPQWLR